MRNEFTKAIEKFLLYTFLCGSIAAIAGCSQKTENDTIAKIPLSSDIVDPVLFLSTQFNPVDEAQKIRKLLETQFASKVTFQPNDNSFIFRQLSQLEKDDTQADILIGALHGDLQMLYQNGELASLSPLIDRLGDRTFNQDFLDLARFDGKSHFYIPWMQATYTMAANKKALPFLPEGADLNSLTYDQFLQWGKNIYEKTGEKKIGFPMGEKGLMHRFFQGYLYPSFTGGIVTSFKSPESINMWQYFMSLWDIVHPASLTYTTMSNPLKTQDIWIAWDHTARLISAFESDPENFVAFPVPSGPKGRSYMAVISGLSIPESSENKSSAELVIEFMTHPEIQQELVKQTGFFPILSSVDNKNMPSSLASIAQAVQMQSSANDSITTMLPSGLGEHGGQFNKIFSLVFSDIVLGGQDIETTLEMYASLINNIFDTTGAPCWFPDRNIGDHCFVE